MYTFTISIAGYYIGVETEIKYLKDMCISYIVDNNPEITIRVLPEDVENEKKLNGIKEEIGYRQYEDFAFLALLRMVADEMVMRNVLLIHGAAINLDNKSYLFTGKSGTGKTTHICKWIQHRPDLTIINGDKPFIRIEEQPMICGSPWGGKEGFSNNTNQPLNAIIILERNDDNNIHELSFSEAFPILLNSIYLSVNPIIKNIAIKLLISLRGRVSFYKYQMNNLKDDCFEVIYNTIHEQGRL